MTDTPEGGPADRPEPDPPKTQPVTQAVPPPPAGKIRVKRSSGKGLAALMFLVGLLIGVLLGGFAGIFAPRTGVLQDLPGPSETTPAPPTITRTVEVEVEVFRTPQDCLNALDDLTGHVDRLAGSRETLMRADLARVSGDEEGASTGFADVDRQLRALIIAGNTRSLRAAVENCRDAGDAGASTSSPEPSPAAEPSPAPAETPGTPESPETPEAPAEPSPTAFPGGSG